MDDPDKQAFLREMSTTNDVDEDLYTASDEGQTGISPVNIIPSPRNPWNTALTTSVPVSSVITNHSTTVESKIHHSVESVNISEAVDDVVAEISTGTSSDVGEILNPNFLFSGDLSERTFVNNTSVVADYDIPVHDSGIGIEQTNDCEKRNNTDVVSDPEELHCLAVELDETIANIPPLVSLSEKLNTLSYAKSEWKGTTYTAECLRQGYKQLIEDTGCKHMRRVRGDNYCALRATAFQVLTQNITVFQSCSNWEEYVINLPERLQQKHHCDWLHQWTFAERLPSLECNKIEVMHACLSYFVEQKKLSALIVNETDRQSHFLSLFNSGSASEIKLFEALKLFMLECAINLHVAYTCGEEIPVFAWLLFARDTSENPKGLMLNHLNPAGKTGGLEQVEMCLLGQALEITIRVFRPSNVEQEDFITHYPDHMIEEWQKIDLIAEDDRHYNLTVH